jgi:hypothetical protein
MRLGISLLIIALASGPAFAACPPPVETVLARDSLSDGGIRLADGRTLKLAGVELSGAGRAALSGLVRGKTLAIRPLGRTDRWNRLPAHIDGVEEALLARGLGHVAAQAEGACLAALLDVEGKARADRAGIWAERDYVLSTNDEAALTAALGRHVIVEGKVITARRSRGRIYLNFARYWKTGLSLIIAEKDWPLFAGGAAEESFAGRRLRVRGRLEYRVGPAILAGPDDRIEVLNP